MKVLFLDIDGVINNPGRGTVRVRGKRTYDPRNVGIVNNVLGDTGAMIVVSSAWRIGRTPDYLAGQLDVMGVHVRRPDALVVTPSGDPHRVVGLTDNRGPARGAEILRWVGAHRALIDSYAIVDDSYDAACLTKIEGDEPPAWHPELRRQFVQTEDRRGLTAQEGGRLTKLLNEVRIVSPSPAVMAQLDARGLLLGDGPCLGCGLPLDQHDRGQCPA